MAIFLVINKPNINIFQKDALQNKKSALTSCVKILKSYY